ncbi:MAG: spoIIQ [Neobacillus sp.]|nr:spoIIQ [Neobacillus sp.]
MYNIRCPVCSGYLGPIVWITLLFLISVKTFAQSIDFNLPLEKLKVTSPFGIRIHPIKLKSIHHNGVDLAARGSPVFNILSGNVVKASVSPTLGKFLVIGSGDILITYGTSISTIGSKRRISAARSSYWHKRQNRSGNRGASPSLRRNPGSIY